MLPLDPRLPAAAAHTLRDDLGEGDHVEDGDALVVATSGTTGEPKGAVLTHAAVAAAARDHERGARRRSEHGPVAAQLPLAHVGGLGRRHPCPPSPRTALTFDETDPAATLTAAVPTQLERDDHRRFRAVLVGGSADWRTERPANVVRTYA